LLTRVEIGTFAYSNSRKKSCFFAPRPPNKIRISG
jgi:hypothetical protein